MIKAKKMKNAPQALNHQQTAIPPNILSNVNWREFVCGWGAAFINISITYPVNKIIFRQMLHGVKIYSAYEQLHTEGIHYLYRGILPPLYQKTFSIAIMFGVYEEVRRPLVDIGVNVYLAKSIAGITAGTTEAVLVPFERIQTLLQDAAYHTKFRNTFHAFKVVGLQYGVREYYRGLVPILLRNGPSNMCFFLIRDEVQKHIPKSTTVFKKTAYEFICGALIGVFLSTVFFPVNVTKVAVQSQLGGEFQGFFKVLRQIYWERGGKLRNMYHGVSTNAAKAFISWGIMNTAYEHIKNIVY